MGKRTDIIRVEVDHELVVMFLRSRHLHLVDIFFNTLKRLLAHHMV
jgi:hypothetical protein